MMPPSNIDEAVVGAALLANTLALVAHIFPGVVGGYLFALSICAELAALGTLLRVLWDAHQAQQLRHFLQIEKTVHTCKIKHFNTSSTELDTLSIKCVYGHDEDWSDFPDDNNEDEDVWSLPFEGDVLQDLKAKPNFECTPMERFLQHDAIDLQQEWRFVKGRIFDGTSLMDWLDHDGELSTIC